MRCADSGKGSRALWNHKIPSDDLTFGRECCKQYPDFHANIISSNKACVVFLEIIVTAAFTDFGLGV